MCLMFTETHLLLSYGSNPPTTADAIAAATSPPPASYTYGDVFPPPPPPPPVPGDGPQGLWGPQGIAVWPQSEVGDVILLVADTENHRVLMLSPPEETA